MNTVTFFTKQDCPLCDAAWFVINRLRRRCRFDLERIDITDPGNTRWFALYANHIPVVHLNGREVCRHRVNERTLRKLLEACPP